MLTFVAYNVVDDTDLFDNGTEIIAVPHTPIQRENLNANYLALLARIQVLQTDVGGYNG